MRHHPFAAALLALGFLAAQPSAQALTIPPLDRTTAAAQPIPPAVPLRDFFRNPDRAYFRISANGRYLSFMQPHGTERRRNIFVQELGADGPRGEVRRLTSETARDIANYFWKGNETLLYSKDFGGDENFHVVAVNARTGEVKDLTPGEKLRASVIDDLQDHPTDVLISHNGRDPKVFDVYRVNVVTGQSTLVARNPGNIISWVPDHAGRVRAAVTSDGVNRTLLYRERETDEFKPVLTTNFRESVEPQFFTFDDKRLYVVSNRGRDKSAAAVLDPATGKEEVLWSHPDVDVGGLTYSRARKALATAEFETWRADRHFFEAETRRVFERLQARLPGYQLSIQSRTRDETRMVVAATSDRTSGVRYVYDSKTDTLMRLGEVTPWLQENQMARVQPVQYTARDGLVINGYLTLPLGRPAKNLPVVVNPHGGPWARDSWGFNPEVQFLVNRGYAVFQTNFRGSTGFGRKFWEASFRQWGRAMQDDITDGVNWLIKEGIADPKRIGIYGASYGGYATLAGVTLTPDLYAAAVSYVGVSNMFTFMNTIPPYWEPLREMFYEMVGNPEKDKEFLRAVSPVFLADRIKTPLLVAQGARDPRVNKAESDQIVEALRKRGVPVEYIVKDNEGHGFANEENQFEFYGAMERFFAKHLKPQQAPQ
jgi:dipeptidyl aminopeptidase/acylaminoacyl peptidase